MELCYHFILIVVSCHDSFPELSPSDALPLLSFRFTPSFSLRTPQTILISSIHTQPGPLGLIPSHLMLQPEPWSEDTPMALGMWRPSEVMGPSCDDHATTCHPCYLISRPVSWWTCDLRVPTLFIFTLFLSHCMLMLHCLLHSGPMHTCCHSRLGGRLYAPLYPVHTCPCYPVVQFSISSSPISLNLPSLIIISLIPLEAFPEEL